jgi:single-stranded-DNA-specific exonuclease
MEKDPAEISRIVSNLVDLNRTRQNITNSALQEAVALIGGVDDDTARINDIIVIHMPNTHESVAGIVAGKLKDKYARPVIVITGSSEHLVKGSGRSVEGYNLFSAILKVRRLLVKYGGHPMAVGITLEKSMIPEFRNRLSKDSGLSPDLLTPKERIDLCVNASEVSFDLINDIARLEPFGRSNPKPTLAMKNLLIEQGALLGTRRNIVRFRLRTPGGGKRLWDAVYFGDSKTIMKKLDLRADDDGNLLGSQRAPGQLYVDIIFHPEINEYNGTVRIQLFLKSVRLSDSVNSHA